MLGQTNPEKSAYVTPEKSKFLKVQIATIAFSSFVLNKNISHVQKFYVFVLKKCQTPKNDNFLDPNSAIIDKHLVNMKVVAI